MVEKISSLEPVVLSVFASINNGGGRLAEQGTVFQFSYLELNSQSMQITRRGRVKTEARTPKTRKNQHIWSLIVTVCRKGGRG
jgi:hypothetical protein